MDQMIKLVSDKAGISEDQAEKAVDTVLGFLKEQLPEPFAGQIDAVIKGDLSGLGNLAGGLGGLFGS